MQFVFSPSGSANPESLTGTLVVGIFQDGVLSPQAVRADKALGGAVKRAIVVSGFKGNSGKVIEVLAPGGPGPNIKLGRILLAGLGKPADFWSAVASSLAADAVSKVLKGETLATFAVDRPKGAKISEAELAAQIAFGATMRAYSFDLYRTKKSEDAATLKKIVIATPAVAAARKAWADLSAVAQGIFLARDLVNEPPNILYPDEFARRTKALSKLGVKVQILGVPEMKKLGMNTLLSVGQGSGHESRLVTMQWNGARGKNAKQAPLAFIGKGVCFDTGGLSIKPANSMMGMKGDMAGAAAVTGLMHALATRKARVNVVGVIGLVENMPDGNALRPNDVVKSMSGATVEVLNTDAEGRLVLADALWYAQEKFKPRFMVDLATLTGAIMVALGLEHAGLFSNDDALSERLIQAGRKEDELLWRLPLSDSYDKLLRSKIADVKNIGGPNAGSITAAQFLQRFVNNVPWAHLDIAGVAWQDAEQKLLAPSWGTGWGVRLLNRLIADNYEK